MHVKNADSDERPRYRRELLLAGVLFCLLTAGSFGLLAFVSLRGLNQRVLDQVVRESREEADRLASALHQLQNQAPEGGARISRAPAELPSGVAAPPRPDPVLGQMLYARLRAFRYVQVEDARGRPVNGVLITEQAMVRGPLLLPARPRTSREPQSVPIEGPDKRYQALDVAVPLATANAPGQVLRVGIPQEEIERRLRLLHRELTDKLLVGGGVSLGLILLAFLYTLTLITRVARAEARSRRTEQLASLGVLASGLAHEIRNPLNAMRMNVQLLQEEVETQPQTAPEVQSMLGSTLKEISRLNRLVSDFLQYARPADPERAAVEVAKLVYETVGLLPPLPPRVHWVRELPAELPPVSGDETQLKQALLNLLLNAVQAVEPGGGGTVTLRAQAIDGWLRLTVADDGPGITPEDQKRLFQAFFSRRRGGTGLGLAIARRLIENGGGRIEVDSSPGAGSRFTLVLPAAAREANA
ncbi:MAG TPA: ATP-binding protein [Acidobacteriota bacterium]